MKIVIVERFGGIEELHVREVPTPEPEAGQVRVRVLSIGMNHADLTGRRGEYRLSTGDPPYTPGLEAGGVIDAVGSGVTERRIGQRVSLTLSAPRLGAGGSGGGGTYRSHYVCAAADTVPVPDCIPDVQLGALWLTYLTSWGCLAWKHGLKAGQFAAFPAASSGVALAGAQIARRLGAQAIGLTSSPAKVEAIRALPGCPYHHLVLTADAEGRATPWYKDLKRITADHGVDVFFDPVAAGPYLESEIRSLAQEGTVYIYGLLGEAGKVDVTPLIRKWGVMRGWLMAQLVAAGPKVCEAGYQHIFDGFAAGAYRQHIARVFKLDEVRAAHEYMEQGKHIGKLVLVP
jgi:NADPH:quinone reductase